MGSKTATIQDEIKQTKPFAFLEQEAVVSLLRTASYVRLQYDHLVQEEGITTQQYNILRNISLSPFKYSTKQSRQVNLKHLLHHLH